MKIRLLYISLLVISITSISNAQTKVYPANDGPNSELINSGITLVEGVTINSALKSATVTNASCPITNEDNDDNAGTGISDNDLDSYLSKISGNAPIEFNIFVEHTTINSAQLSILAWDVDWNAYADPNENERDAVYFNDHFLGYLSGADGTWSTSIFNLDPTWVIPGPSGKNSVRIEIDVNNTGYWAVSIEWGQLSIDGSCSSGTTVAELRSVSTPASIFNSCAVVPVTIEPDATPDLNVRIETNILDPDGNIIAGTSRSLTATGGDEPFTENLTIPCSAIDGDYQVVTILYDGNTNVQLDIEYVPIVVSSCSDDIIIENTPGVCGVIVNYNTPAGLMMEGLASGELFPVGTTIVTFANPECSFTVTVSDSEAPAISCPKDIEVFADPNACGAVITYSIPTATDNCGLLLSDFDGYFDPVNWDLKTNGGNGSVDISGAPSQLVINSSDNNGPSDCKTEFEIVVPSDGIMYFDWDYVTADIHGAYYDPFGYSINGVFVQLSTNETMVFNDKGSLTLPVSKGDVFAFVTISTDNILGASSTTTVNFSFSTENAISGVIANGELTTGLASGELFPIGVTKNTYKAVDASGNITECSFNVTVKERPTVLTNLGVFEGQYSDEVTLKAQLKDELTDELIKGKQVTLTFDGVDYLLLTDVNGEVSKTLTLDQNPCDDFKVIAEFAGECPYLPSTDSDDFDVAPEKASMEYTGTIISATVKTGSDDFVVTLRGVVIDDNDGFAGDVSNAMARFVVDGSDVSDWLPVMLIDATDPSIGIIESEWTSDIGKDDVVTYDVQIEIMDCYYTGLSIAHPLTVYNAAGDFITGGGHMLMTDAAGLYQPTVDSKLNFGFNVKFNKKGTNLQGKMNIIYREFDSAGDLINKYQIKSNATTSLGTNLDDENALIAEFVSKANLITLDEYDNVLSTVGNLTLHVTMTDKGEPGSEDEIAFSLYNGDSSDPNALWFSSNWSGINTIEQVINGGNLVIHSGAAIAGDEVVEVPKGKGKNKSGFVPENLENSLKAYPNPFKDRLCFEFSRGMDSDARLELFDATGRKISVLFEQKVKADEIYRVEYVPQNLSTNMIIYRMTYDNEVVNGRMVYSK